MITKKPLFSWVLERHRALQLLLFLLILLTIFLRVFPLEMQKRIVNTAIAFRKIDVLLVYCGLYLAAVVSAGALKYLINVLQGFIGQRILLDLRTRLYDHILNLPLPFFRRTPPGMVISSLTSELSAVGEFLGGALAVPLINVLTLLTFAAYLAHLNPLLALISFSIYPAEILIIPVLQKRFNLLNQRRIDVTRSMSNVIGEAISGMHEIHGNAGHRLESLKLGGFAASLFHIRHRMNIFKFLTKFVNNFFQSLGPFVLFLLGGYLTIQGRLDLGALVAFLSAYEKLYDPWKELMDYYQGLQDSKVRYRQVMEYFDERPDFELLPAEDRKPYDLEGPISVTDLTYQAEGRVRILDQVSLDIQRGEQLAIVGQSGSGKSTLAMIIGQLYSYTSGHVTIGGRELKTLTKYDVSHNIGYVAQHPFIFDGTILENVLYASKSLDRSFVGGDELPGRGEILSVLENVGLSEDILRIGMDSTLSRERHEQLARELLSVRGAFMERWKVEPAGLVDFFDENRFQYHLSVGENITFGSSEREGFQTAQFAGNPQFRRFLEDEGIMPSLVELGAEIALQTVSLLEGLEQDAYFFRLSPIEPQELDEFKDIAERMTRSEKEEWSGQDKRAILSLALRFRPALHKMASLSPAFEESILRTRRRFREKMSREDPHAFAFYRPSEYLFSQSILNNVLFGHPKSNRPDEAERIRQHVVDLLKDRGLLEEVTEAGLEFRVGSKGDRLSGGQKQKIAIARVLLKRPHILIFDEATASLDNASQNRIQALIHYGLRGKSTLISVVHRLEMVRDYDQIAVMKAGKIVEIGQYEELTSRKGLFYELAHGIG